MELGKKQELVDAGKTNPIVLFPEGATTNNTELIQFKRGAFFALCSVRPVTFNYSSRFFQPSHDILNIFVHVILTTCQPYTSIVVHELPVFTPNEYFYKNHVKPGEEKW